MGAWNYDVLSNDYVLDELDYYIMRNADPETCMYSMLRSRDEYCALLGVAMLDAYINGIDHNLLGSYPTSDYTKFIKKMIKGKKVNVSEYLPYAKEALDHLIDMGAKDWREPNKRMQLYFTYQDRLGF